MDSRVFFSERQRFRQWWLWILLTGGAALLVFRIVSRAGQDGAGQGLWIPLLLIFGSMGLIYAMSLDTEIREDGIYVRFFPFRIRFKKYLWNQLMSVEVRRYSALGEYGGWGIRFALWGFPKNKALNISGNMGIQLRTQNGYSLLIGTRKPEEAREVLEKLKRSNRDAQ